ncbi:hypothetical protein KUL25_04140 [Rhodobacteraceae bacterium N5(2021)]|uniref:Uncharacterized protein n=1 Tax=Gymnodinialimonas phycosphaerae TaxID=2841589 RepID=A0A975YGP7_9RHOB|nr:hypothetical protein [Gymnodinialimonas phycosphaerae]MBY4891951.1 hypothetical protein [Gymnodinialimonas phycosphaerae]
MNRQSNALRIAGGAAIIFGLLTVVSGGATLLDGLDMGAVVYFVLLFNALAGLAYIVAGFGLWQGRRWAFALSLLIFLATVLVFAGFGLHVAQGGAYEMRTVFAMALRCAVWGALTLVARKAYANP